MPTGTQPRTARAGTCRRVLPENPGSSDHISGAALWAQSGSCLLTWTAMLLFVCHRLVPQCQDPRMPGKMPGHRCRSAKLDAASSIREAERCGHRCSLHPTSLRRLGSGYPATKVTVLWKQPCHVRFLIPALHLLARTTAKAHVWFQERESSSVDRFSNSQPVLRTRPLPGPPTPAAGSSVTQSQLCPHSLWPQGFQRVPSAFGVRVDSPPPGI